MFVPVQLMKAMASRQENGLNTGYSMLELHYRLRSIQKSFDAPADGLLL